MNKSRQRNSRIALLFLLVAFYAPFVADRIGSHTSAEFVLRGDGQFMLQDSA